MANGEVQITHEEIPSGGSGGDPEGGTEYGGELAIDTRTGEQRYLSKESGAGAESPEDQNVSEEDVWDAIMKSVANGETVDKVEGESGDKEPSEDDAGHAADGDGEGEEDDGEDAGDDADDGSEHGESGTESSLHVEINGVKYGKPELEEWAGNLQTATEKLLSRASEVKPAEDALALFSSGDHVAGVEAIVKYAMSTGDDDDKIKDAMLEVANALNNRLIYGNSGGGDAQGGATAKVQADLAALKRREAQRAREKADEDRQRQVQEEHSKAVEAVQSQFEDEAFMAEYPLLTALGESGATTLVSQLTQLHSTTKRPVKVAEVARLLEQQYAQVFEAWAPMRDAKEEETPEKNTQVKSSAKRRKSKAKRVASPSNKRLAGSAAKRRKIADIEDENEFWDSYDRAMARGVDPFSE